MTTENDTEADSDEQIIFEYDFEDGDEIVYKDYTKDESGNAVERLRAGRILETPPISIVLGKDCINPKPVTRDDSYRIASYSDDVWSFMLPDRIVGPLSVHQPDVNTLDQPYPRERDY